MTYKKTTSIICAIALAGCLALVGCGGSPAATSPAQSEPAATEAATATESVAAETAAPATETQDQAAATDASATSTDAQATSTEAQTAEPAQPATEAPAAPATTEAYITNAEAEAAALAHAGVAQADATVLTSELDLDDGVAHYDVDLKVGNMEYDYTIDAVTGNVLAYESEIDD